MFYQCGKPVSEMFPIVNMTLSRVKSLHLITLAKEIIISHDLYKKLNQKLYHHYVSDTNFNPTIELTNVNKKNNRQNVAGSLNKNIPTITEPTAPMPVQTA